MSTLVSDSFLDLTMATAGDDDDRILFGFRAICSERVLVIRDCNGRLVFIRPRDSRWLDDT